MGTSQIELLGRVVRFSHHVIVRAASWELAANWRSVDYGSYALKPGHTALTHHRHLQENSPSKHPAGFKSNYTSPTQIGRACICGRYSQLIT